MTAAAQLNQYLSVQVNSSTPEQLLVLLYNGAIRFLNEAEDAMTEGRIAQRGALISRTINILTELSASLDHEVGGEISANLEALYLFMNRELMLANLKDDAERLIRVRQMLVGLRDTWDQAIAKVQAERRGEEVPASEPTRPAEPSYPNRNAYAI